MKQLLKTLSVFSFFLFFLLFPGSSSAWWTQLRPGDKPMHFYLMMLSEDTFRAHSLYDKDMLFAGSNDPDEHKSLSHNDPNRIRYSFCAALGDQYQGNKNMAIRRLARSVHYLADFADPTDKVRDKGAMRKQAYDLISSKSPVTSNPLWKPSVSNYSQKVRTLTYQELTAYARDETAKIVTALDKAGKDKKAIDDIFIRCFALIKACQDRLIVLFKEERGRDASVICRDQPVFCDRARDNIRQACKAKDIKRANTLMNQARTDKCALPRDMQQQCTISAVCGEKLPSRDKSNLVFNFLVPLANKWPSGIGTANYRGLKGLMMDGNFFALQYEFNVAPWKAKVTCIDDAFRTRDCRGRTASDAARCKKRIETCNTTNKMWDCPAKKRWW